MPHATQMSAADTALLVIDVQEKLLPKILDHAAILRNISFLLDAALLVGVPAQATEQYPRGLGPTVPELASYFSERPEKVAFSSCAIPSVVESLHRGARPKVVLAGIETHVCVLNTALDLLALDFRVYLAVDAIGARFRIDHDVALRRLEQAGAILTTTEGCVFEWMGGSKHPQFKAVSLLVQARMKHLEGDKETRRQGDKENNTNP
jgi:nicotinamidase-related amidase